MDIRLAVVVFGVLLIQAHGHPTAAEEDGVTSPKDATKILPLEVSGAKDAKRISPPEFSSPKDVKKVSSPEFSNSKDAKISPLEVSAPKKTTVGKEGEASKKASLVSLGTKLKTRLFEDSKLSTSSKEVQDEAIRSARQSPSPPFHQMSFGKGPHSTTVCIQIRSDHQPKVICGPQYGDRESPPSAPATPAAARFASPYDYARAAPSPYLQASPAPGRGYPTRRTEAELQPRPVDPNTQPANGIGPQHLQTLPHVAPTAQPSPVYVHRQYYEPAYSTGLLSPTQALMRLNCAVEPLNGGLVRGGPLGYQDQQPFGETVLINPDGSPAKYGANFGNPQLVHGGGVGFQDQPHGQAVFTLPDGSPAKFGSNIVSPPPVRMQSNYATPQGQHWARSAAEEDMAYLSSQMMGSQNYASGSGHYGGYQGEPYPLDLMQGRSASSEDSSHAYLGYPGSVSATEDFARREYVQLQALRESKEKLREIQEQLTSMREREELQKLSAKNSSTSETSKDSTVSGLSIDIKATPTKSSKRQTRTQ